MFVELIDLGNIYSSMSTISCPQWMVDRIQDDKAIFMLHSLRLLYGERNLCMPTRVPCMIFERSPKWIFLKRFFCTSNATCTKFAYNELEKKMQVAMSSYYYRPLPNNILIVLIRNFHCAYAQSTVLFINIGSITVAFLPYTSLAYHPWEFLRIFAKKYWLTLPLAGKNKAIWTQHRFNRMIQWQQWTLCYVWIMG